MPKYPRYQDYFIRNGEMVGEFEEMYRDFGDPWHQTDIETFASDKAVGINLLRKLLHLTGRRRALEIGCGFGHYVHRIAEAGYEATGIDIAPTAVAKARDRYPACSFHAGSIDQHEFVKSLEPDVIVMAEVTWYVLERLRPFVEFLRREMPRTRLLHLLSFYAPGEQKYGCGYFTNLDEAVRFFGMNCLEAGEVRLLTGQRRTWFLGEWDDGLRDAWATASGIAKPEHG